MRIVDPDSNRQRILTSVWGQRQKCEHRWHGGYGSESIDPIRVGDLLFIAYGANLYVLVVEQVGPHLQYRIAALPLADSLASKVDLTALQWQEKRADEGISIPGRSIPFHIDDMGEAILVVYDNYYGYLGRRWGLDDENPAFMAIVHRSDLADKNVVELARFSLKTWEDGLGNLCPPRIEPPAKTKELQTPAVPNPDPNTNNISALDPADNKQRRVDYLELHEGPIWDVGCPSDVLYIATAGNDGRIVISYFVDPVRTVVGPFGSTSRFYSMAVSQDGRTIVAGGDFQSGDAFLKTHLPEMALEFVPLPPGTGTVKTMSFCEPEESLACLTSPGALTIVGEDGSAERFESPAQWFMFDRDGNSKPAIVDTPCDPAYSVVSPNCGFCARLCTIKLQPVGHEYALIVFDRKGHQTVCHKSNRFSPSASRCVFVAEDHLVLFLSHGALMEWKSLGDTAQWKLVRTLRTAAGPFSAAAASPDGRSVWLARESAVFEVDLASGATRREVVLKVGESPSDPDLPIRPVPPVTDLALVPRLNVLVAALRDGRVALIDLSERATSKEQWSHPED